MGYTFTIGNASPKFSKDDFPYLSARWEVEGATHPDAPVFPNDEMTGNSNSRSPSYTVWSDFARETGLYQFFYDDRGHLNAVHPGCIGLTKEDADLISAALARYQVSALLPPGFEGWDYNGPARYDYHLARLIWLDWWVRWAVENCETPAMENT
jgi:hypothetical protein